MRVQIRLMFGTGVLILVTSGFYENDSDRWGSVGVTAFIFLLAFGFQIALKMAQPIVVVLQPEGLRYGHLPESPLVPWAKIQSVRERRLAGRLDLVDVEGETCFYLTYDLEGFAELRDLVLEHVPLALPTPVRFRRSWGLDAILIFFALVLLSALFVSLWYVFVVPMTGYYLIVEEGKSPYAVQVTDSELILSFVFRTRTIPLQGLKFTSATQNCQGTVLQLLQFEDAESKRDIIVRNVGVDMIVLKATIQEAIRIQPLACS